MIYLDTSALVKLAIEEPESRDLEFWLMQQDGRLTSSVIARVELTRACRRSTPAGATSAQLVLADMPLVPLSPAVVEIAENLDPPLLRTLDALHLASAIELHGELTTFVVYDKRLREAAVFAGLPVVSPGLA
jgi:predicted nucleic acid-binding protein